MIKKDGSSLVSYVSRVHPFRNVPESTALGSYAIVSFALLSSAIVSYTRLLSHIFLIWTVI